MQTHLFLPKLLRVSRPPPQPEVKSLQPFLSCGLPQDILVWGLAGWEEVSFKPLGTEIAWWRVSCEDGLAPPVPETLTNGYRLGDPQVTSSL